MLYLYSCLFDIASGGFRLVNSLRIHVQEFQRCRQIIVHKCGYLRLQFRLFSDLLEYRGGDILDSVDLSAHLLIGDPLVGVMDLIQYLFIFTCGRAFLSFSLLLLNGLFICAVLIVGFPVHEKDASRFIHKSSFTETAFVAHVLDILYGGLIIGTEGIRHRSYLDGIAATDH